MRRSFAVGSAVAMLLTGSLLSACGDDDSDTTSGPSPAGDAPVSLPGSVADHGSGDVSDAGALELELDDQYFAPTFVNAPAGATVEVTLTNEGDLPHTFTIDGAGVDEQLDGGESATVDVTMPASGSLRFYCRLHVAAGMQGAFVVSAGDGPATTIVSGGAPGY